jgi:hypothetical protein
LRRRDDECSPSLLLLLTTTTTTTTTIIVYGTAQVDDPAWMIYRGSSNVADDDYDEATCASTPRGCLQPIRTDLVCAFEDCSTVSFASGEALNRPLWWWLAAANVSLDEVNEGVTADYRDNVSRPFFRSTGLRLEIELHYTNKNRQTGQAEIVENTSVTTEARVRSSKHDGLWAGLGPVPFYEVYPTGPSGAQVYSKATRYRQGVLATFRGTGSMYRFDVMQAVLALVSAIVLLGVAGTVTDLFAVNMLEFKRDRSKTLGFSASLSPVSQMLRAKRFENVDPDGVFARQAFSAALAVDTFHSLDKDKDGKITSTDLRMAFDSIPEINPTQARYMSSLIMKMGNDDRIAKGNQAKDDFLDFAEFCSLVDSDVVSFQSFLGIMDRKGERGSFTRADNLADKVDAAIASATTGALGKGLNTAAGMFRSERNSNSASTTEAAAAAQDPEDAPAAAAAPAATEEVKIVVASDPHPAEEAEKPNSTQAMDEAFAKLQKTTSGAKDEKI